MALGQKIQAIFLLYRTLFNTDDEAKNAGNVLISGAIKITYGIYFNFFVWTFLRG